MRANSFVVVLLNSSAFGRLSSPLFSISRRCFSTSCRVNMDKREGWDILVSKEATNTVNPIRHCSEIHFLEPLSKCRKKEIYKINVGDPAVFGNLPTHPAVTEALTEAAASGAYCGMTPSTGLPEAKQCVAEQFSKYSRSHPVAPRDVFMTCGTHGGLELGIRVLCEPGSTLLLPRPCYPFFKYQGDGMGLNLQYYNLLPDSHWQVDLEHLEKQLEGGPAAMVVNNPSNPCGSVYPKSHLLDILALAEKHRVPIISDEVYAHMVFEGEEFHSLGGLSENVPVLTCGSISKRFLVPGWRCGWVVMQDRHDILGDKLLYPSQFQDQHDNGMLTQVRAGLTNLMMKLIAPPAVMQAAIPAMYKNVPESFFKDTMKFFKENARLCYEGLKDAPGLTPLMPAGALYIMVKIDMPSFPEFENDLEFLKQLILEQGIVALPGYVFQFPGTMRIVLIMPKEKMSTVCSRIHEFCRDHYMKK